MKAHQKEYSEEEFEKYLNDTYGEVEVCGMPMYAGTILRECDPIAFRCSLSDCEGSDEMWICSECDREFHDKDEADECCKDEEEI